MVMRFAGAYTGWREAEGVRRGVGDLL